MTLSTLVVLVTSTVLLVSCVSSSGDGAATGSRFRDPTYLGAAGARTVASSPLTLEELGLLEETLLLGEDDLAALRRSRAVLEPHVEEILDVWYGFVGANPHLLASFSGPEGPDAEYLAAVRQRFGRWILDTADARYDRDWLDFQHEIGLRHHRVRKNVVDGANAAEHVPFRYLVALTSPVTTTLRPFLERGDHGPDEVDAMHRAWVKAVLLQVILWSHPYVRDGDF